MWMLTVSMYYIFKGNWAIYQGVALSWSTRNKAHKVKHRKQSKEIVSLTYLLGTGDTNTFIQQHKLMKHAYK